MVCKSLIKGWWIRLRITWMVRNLLKIMSPPPHPKYILFIKLTDFFQFRYNFVVFILNRMSDGQSVITFTSWFIFGFPIAVVTCLITWVVLQIYFFGVKWVSSETFVLKLENSLIYFSYNGEQINVVSNFVISTRRACIISFTLAIRTI